MNIQNPHFNQKMFRYIVKTKMLSGLLYQK